MCSNAGALVGHVRVPAWGVKYMAVLCWSCLGMEVCCGHWCSDACLSM